MERLVGDRPAQAYGSVISRSVSSAARSYSVRRVRLDELSGDGMHRLSAAAF